METAGNLIVRSAYWRFNMLFRWHSSGECPCQEPEKHGTRRIALVPQTITKGMDSLRRMDSLKTIQVVQTEYTPEEFWKGYDAGQFKK